MIECKEGFTSSTFRKRRSPKINDQKSLNREVRFQLSQCQWTSVALALGRPKRVACRRERSSSLNSILPLFRLQDHGEPNIQCEKKSAHCWEYLMNEVTVGDAMFAPACKGSAFLKAWWFNLDHIYKSPRTSAFSKGGRNFQVVEYN